MAIIPSGVSVPAQSKELDNTTVTTSYGTVYRQVVCLADPETQNYYQRVGLNGAYVDVRNVVALPLPTGASTSALQTTGNNTLSAIDTKLGGTLAVNVGLTDAELRASNVNVAVNSALPPGANTIGSIANTSFAATQSGTWNVTNISGTVSLPTGASTSALQTTGNASLSSVDTKLTTTNSTLATIDTDTGSISTSVSSIDTKTPALVTGRVPVDGSGVTQPVSAASLPLPTSASTSALQTTINDTLTSFSAKFSVLGQAAMASSQPVVLSSDHSDIPTKTKGDSFSNISTLGTTTVKSGAGILRRIVINTKGSGSNILTVYDNTAGSGTIIATIDTSDKISNIEYGLSFSVGLTIVNATGTSANVTVIYE